MYGHGIFVQKTTFFFFSYNIQCLYYRLLLVKFSNFWVKLSLCIHRWSSKVFCMPNPIIRLHFTLLVVVTSTKMPIDTLDLGLLLLKRLFNWGLSWSERQPSVGVCVCLWVANPKCTQNNVISTACKSKV